MKIITHKILAVISLIIIIGLVATIIFIVYNNYYNEKYSYTTKEDPPSKVIRHKNGGLLLETKWEDGKIYFKLEIKDNYYKVIDKYHGFEDEYVVIVFLDTDNFNIDEYKIKAYNLTNYKSRQLYSYNGNKNMSLQEYKRIRKISYRSNFLFK